MMEQARAIYERAAAMVPPELAEAASPYAAALRDGQAVVVRHLQPLLEPLLARAQPRWDAATAAVDAALAPLAPWQLALAASLATALALLLAQRAARRFRRATERGVLQWAFAVVRGLPGLSALFAAPVAKAMTQVAAKLATPGEETFYELPAKGAPAGPLLAMLKQRSHRDVMFSDGQSSASGTVYMASEAHKQLMDQVGAWLWCGVLVGGVCVVGCSGWCG
jgi:hypothetical protein